MRSDRIHKALANIPNRFVLCRLVSVATRKFLGPDRRVQDVINDVIGWFADTEFATQQLRILADLRDETPRRIAVSAKMRGEPLRASTGV